jgi:hypothetical protein
MAKTPRGLLDAIERRSKALRRKWLDEAEKIVKIYEADESEAVPFNILYSNTETILPALYNSTPRPEVARRYTQVGNQNSLDSVVAQVGERLLEYTADSNSGEYETFDAAVRGAVLNGLVPGQGVVRVRYHTDENFQQLCFDRIAYDRFVWGYARKWLDVPWVAFGYDLNKADFEKTFPEFAAKAVYKEFRWEEAETENEDEVNRRSEAGVRKEPTLLVWEVWTAATREIQFVSSIFAEDFLREEPYPFDLTMRFPMPEPLKFVLRNDNLTPVPPYKLYERQAQELNEVTRRLQIVLKAIKVRGGYNGQLSELSRILESDDTTLIPVENASAIAEAGGIDKHIWLMPLQELITVARELYQAQISCKSTIYEIMGIGDILRGATQASETARAQEIKNQWGSLRIKRSQKNVMEFCRDLFRVAFEFAANLYTPATLMQITKLPLITQGQKQLAMKAMPPPQPGQPLQGPPELLQSLALPTWEEVIGVLRDRFERTYRIDIETNSTVDLEATEDKAQIAEFMNAFGQMTAGLQPMVESGAMPFEAAKLVMGEVFRRFRFARRVERALDLIQAPQPKEDPKAVQEKHAAEIAKVQAESKRQIGEMQESIIEATKTIAKLEIQLEGTKTGAAIDQKKNALDNAQRTGDLKADYRGKADLMKGEMLKMQDQNILAQVQQMIQQGQRQMEQMLNGAKTEFGASQKVLAAKEQTAAARAEAPMQVAQQFEQALAALAQNQAQMMQAIQQVAALAGAEREAELIIGPDGRKRSRSRVVMQ